MIHPDQVEILEQIAIGAPLSDILLEIVRLVESRSAELYCSILLLDRDQQTLSSGAAPRLPPEYVRAIDGLRIGPNAGSCGAAAFRRERVFVEDIATHENWKDFKSLALPHGLAACWSSPIFTQKGEVLGTFAIYYRQRRGPSPEEVEWVNMATHLASIAICRDAAESRLRQSEARAVQLSKLYSVAAAIKEIMVRTRQTTEVYDGACRIAVESGLLRMVWIGVRASNLSKLMPVARFGIDDGLADLIVSSDCGASDSSGVASKALTSEAPSVCNELASETELPCRDELLRRGIHSCAAFPIRTGAHVAGVVCFYADRPEFFLEDELHVFAGIASNLSLATQAAGLEAERRRLVHDLSARIKQLTLLHRVSRLLQKAHLVDSPFLANLASSITLGWQFSETCQARICWSELYGQTAAFVETEWMQSALFQAGGRPGRIDVVYLSAHPAADEGPFLADERRCLDSLAEMLGSHLERQVANLALCESEERLRAVIEHTPNVAVQWYDSEGRVLFWNTASAVLFGWNESESLSRTLDQLIFTPEQARDFVALLRRVRETGDPAGPMEFPFRRRDGSTGVTLSTVFPIPLSNGQVGFACMDVDLTDRKIAERNLKDTVETLTHASQKLQFHLDRVPLAFLVWDSDLIVSDWNPAAERIFGWTADEAIGRDLIELIVPEDAVPHVRRVWADLAAGGDWSFHSVNDNVRKDGKRIVCEWHNAPLRDPSGKIIGCLSLGADISARKLEEENRAQLEAQFRQSERMQSLGTLAGGIAHDFNNILTIVSGNLALCRESAGANSQTQEQLATIGIAIERAKALVCGILAFSRRQEPKRQSVRISAILSETLMLLRSAIPSSVEIVSEIEDGLPKTLADPTQIHQVLMNLGANAAHAIGEMSGRIEFSLSSVVLDGSASGPDAECQPGRYILIKVTDTGCGMDDATVKRIFEPFFTTKEPGSGTGLGLSVVHGIVKGHGGIIKVHSRVGSGTTFELYFPASDSTETEIVHRPCQPRRGESQRILCVDDEEPLVFLLVRFLEQLNYKVTGFTDPIAALKAFREDPEAFDAVVSDFTMPSLRGSELAGRLREIRPDIPIILTSGYIRDEDIAAVQPLNLVDFILKPNTVDDLSQILHRLFSERARAPQSN